MARFVVALIGSDNTPRVLYRCNEYVVARAHYIKLSRSGQDARFYQYNGATYVAAD